MKIVGCHDYMISLTVSPQNFLKRSVILGLMLGSLVSAEAVERTLKIEAPVAIRAGKEFPVTISASTNAGAGEQVGFLQAESSVDEGKTWVALCYLQKSGPHVVQEATVKTTPTTQAVQLRARAAFRDGLAGDVDFNGAAIRWDKGWNTWESPPAKLVKVKVTGR